MRYLVAGTGALGSVFGGLLQHSGQPVDFLGRGQHFAQAREQGLEIDGIWGNFRLSPIPAAPPEVGEPYEVILLCVKSFDTREACRQLRGWLAPQGLVISIQNGLGNLELIAQEFNVPELTPARHRQVPDLAQPATLAGSRRRDYFSAVAPFSPSSLSLRVRVLRPQPRSFAASWR